MSNQLSTAKCVIYCEPDCAEDRRLAWTRCLLHADQQCYTIVGVAEGKQGWLSCEAMLAAHEVDLVVTTARTSHSSDAHVEVAGAGRTRLSTYTRAARMRQIAQLIDAGLSDEAIVRALRRS